MKLLVVIDQFKVGGGARVTSLMLKGLANRGIEIVLAVDNVNYEIFYEIPREVKIVTLHSAIKGNGILHILRRIIDLSCQIRNIIKVESPNVLIGIMPLSFLYLLLANFSFKLPLIAVDHTSFNRKTLPLTTLIRNKLYKYSDVLSILTQRDAKYLGKKYPQKVVIYNPLTYKILEIETNRKKTILCAGRFDFWKVKGLDILAQIWGKIANDYPEWRLQIAGSGSDSNTKHVYGLFEKACPKGSFEFLGQVSDMKHLYSTTSIYALTSRIEGFPMVLMEAMSQGCACVAFSIDGATKEMMNDGYSGYIVNDGDIDNFILKLRYIIENDVERRNLSINARKDVGRFSLDNFINKWMNVLDSFDRK